MGISRDSEHKHRATGGKRPQTRKKRQFLLGRPAAMTKLAPHRVHQVRTRGGNIKYRALRLDQGNTSRSSYIPTLDKGSNQLRRFFSDISVSRNNSNGAYIAGT